MKNAYAYQFLVNLLKAEDDHTFPRYLRELVRQGDIEDFERLHLFLRDELENAFLQTEEQGAYFLFLIREAVRYSFFSRLPEEFLETLSLVRHRMAALRNLDAPINLRAWEAYLEFTEAAFRRLMRHTPIERFEEALDHLDWERFDEQFISDLSGLLGFVYLNEESGEQASKARLWLMKAIHSSDTASNLLHHYLMAAYFFQHGGEEDLEQLLRISSQLQTEDVAEAVKPLFEAAAFELQALAWLQSLAHADASAATSEELRRPVRKLEADWEAQRAEANWPAFTHWQVQAHLGRLQVTLANLLGEEEAQDELIAKAIERIDELISQTASAKHPYWPGWYRLERIELAVEAHHSLAEKEVRESYQFFKKKTDYPMTLRSLQGYILMNELNGQAPKNYDLITELLRQGLKRLEEGGFYLINKALALANHVFLRETNLPGVSWMIPLLDDFFALIREVVDLMPDQHELIGPSDCETFRNFYMDFEPVSHFNIRTYFRYQLYELKMMRLGAILHGDKLTLKLANHLIGSLESGKNPLHLMNGDWEDFKGEPNEVRNKTLNKCINISKGDLPLAAEHLDFSYRNLRSYITFKEVNRLGFFLELQETNNRQLEQGIRLMFYDLYKQGTIFEVVFDMPRFLVSYAKTGFFSQDLETELNIKGTTAKKYIKIMIEVGLIRQDKNAGRKHFYQIIPENIMNRLGQDQAILISSDA